MGSTISQIALIAFGGCLLGALCAWSIQAVVTRRRIALMTSEAEKKLTEVLDQRDGFAGEYAKSKSRVAQLETATARLSAELESALERSKVLGRNVQVLKTERETTKIKVAKIQKAFVSLRQQTTALQNEFHKTRTFFKRELLKGLKQRKDLEEELRNAQAEQESLSRLVESSAVVPGYPGDSDVTAQVRSGQLGVLQRNINRLEAENAQLVGDVRRMKLELSARDRDMAQLEELKLHNKQLVRCVEALEDSRKAHEVEAERFRQQADESEKMSDTLRLKLDDLEKNFADMEKQQDRALTDARKATVVPILSKQG